MRSSHVMGKRVFPGLAAFVVHAGSAVAAESTTAGAPLSPISAGAIVQTILGLILVIVIIVAVAWLLRRVSQLHAGAQSALKVVASLSLGARERVVLMQVGDRQLLLGIAPGNIHTLHVLETAIPSEKGGMGNGTSFPDRLKQMLGQATSRSKAMKPGGRP